MILPRKKERATKMMHIILGEGTSVAKRSGNLIILIFIGMQSV